MSDTVISVENLGKKYRIGGLQDRHRQFREVLVGSFIDPFKRLARIKRRIPEEEIIWALTSVSFRVKRGEVLGIIGANGAGKTTLLKILSRITLPTDGRIEVRGRVGSLLEVGTGFHPEMTGRENIYLNGGILGMSRQEIRSKFDEIVEFSGIGKFIDTPVKRYSSGMYVRLAFSVAAHLEPEILVVDEVLAVGDLRFQEKCMDKMQNVAEAGRTVLFVSHNMHAVKALCDRAILLNQGRLEADGEVENVISTYLKSVDVTSADGVISADKPRFGTGEALLRYLSLRNREGDCIKQIYMGQPFQVNMIFEVKSPIEDAKIQVGISSTDGMRVVTAFNTDKLDPPFSLQQGIYLIKADIEITLLPRKYVLDISIHSAAASGRTIDFVERTIEFTVINMAEKGMDCHRPAKVRGFVRPNSSWSIPESLPATALAELLEPGNKSSA